MKMNAELKQRWVDALRSGKFAQGTERLCTTDGKYCCLGVLEMIADGDVERYAFDGESKYMISPEWVEAHNVSADVTELGLLANMNDGDELLDIRRHSFLEIADYIEASVEGI